MSDGRRRRKAKQLRRDMRRARNRNIDAAPEPTPGPDPADPPSNPLIAEDPWNLLVFASMQVQASKPDPLAKFRSRQRDSLDFDYLLTQFLSDPAPWTATLVALFAELLDDEELQPRYRDAARTYKDLMPAWAAGLGEVEVSRAVRVSDVLGDFDHVALGVRLADGREATCVVVIDHLISFEITDALLSLGTIDTALERISDPDVAVIDMSLADARAWIQQGLDAKFLFRESATWPDCRPLVQWLIGHLPEGGVKYQSPAWDWNETEELCEEFFASEEGAPFARRDHDDILQELMDSGTGDPLRWSAERVERALDSPISSGHHSLKVFLEVPDLLRAFITYAHKRSGVRGDLTAQTLAVLDEIPMGYRRMRAAG